MSFDGFPVAALDFYDDLEVDNTKAFWDAHRSVYQESVLAPMKALTEALAGEFGTAKVFRPYNDVRFAKGRPPYKAHQGAFVSLADSTGFYVELSPRGVRTGAGCYWFEPGRLASFRTDVANDLYGKELEKILAKVRKQGYEVSGEQLKTTPRGYDKDHVRIDLLRRKQLLVGRMVGFEPVIHTAELLDVVRADWRAYRPTVEWIARHSIA